MVKEIKSCEKKNKCSTSSTEDIHVKPNQVGHKKTTLVKKEKTVKKPQIVEEVESDIESEIEEENEEGFDEKEDTQSEQAIENEDAQETESEQIDDEEEAEGEEKGGEEEAGENAEVGGDGEGKKSAFKVFFLTIHQLKEKEMQLQQRVKELSGAEHKNKRKRMFYELKQISNALENPDKYVRNPYDEIRKRKVDTKKRIQKKISKKRINDNKKKSDKRRERRQIVGMQCLGCKEIGHLVADCPNVKKQKQNICYNCGSSEHSLKDCKKKKNGSTLKFAFCFVCKKNGHISRDCPKNEKGLYMQGGGCFICGDVHHTQQNCPKNPINSMKLAKTNQPPIHPTHPVDSTQYKKNFKNNNTDHSVSQNSTNQA